MKFCSHSFILYYYIASETFALDHRNVNVLDWKCTKTQECTGNALKGIDLLQKFLCITSTSNALQHLLLTAAARASTHALSLTFILHRLSTEISHIFSQFVNENLKQINEIWNMGIYVRSYAFHGSTPLYSSSQITITLCCMLYVYVSMCIRL